MKNRPVRNSNKYCVFCGKIFEVKKTGRKWFRTRACSKCTRWFNVPIGVL